MANLNTVGVNLLWLAPGVVGGSEEYTIRLLRSADDVNQQAELTDRLSFRLYLSAELLDAYPDLSDRFECVIGPKVAASPFARKGMRIGVEHSWLAAASRHDAVLHHAGGTVPFVRSATSVVTVHDLQPLEFPENFSPIKRRWLHTMLPRAVQAARTVICPSQFTAERIVELLGTSPTKITVVSHGHDPSVVSHPNPTGFSAKKFGTFVLYPAIMYPHKRHIDVVHALDRLRTRIEDLNVVFTGRPGPELESVLSAVHELNLQDRVHILGRVPSADLDVLYGEAAVTVIPSSYEGFGNPALEAMARGCPLIVADAAALPEVVGDGGRVVPVGAIDAWADAIDEVVSDPAASRLLVEAGLVRSASYDWATAGSTLLNVYRQAGGPYRR